MTNWCVEYILRDIYCSNSPNSILMMNRIQGHDLGRKFKALVCHDGKISTAGSYSTEELWFIEHDFNGTVWNNPDNYARWDPINHAKNFSTPQFIIHSDLDYRVIVGEGLTLFNVLQSLGVPCRFLNFPNENHWVTNRQNSLVWYVLHLFYHNALDILTDFIQGILRFSTG